MKKTLEFLTDHYKPIWMFWHPGSGLIGGLIFGTIIAYAIIIIFG